MPPPGISPNSPLPTPHFIYPDVLESMFKARQLDLETEIPSPIPLFSLSTIASATFSGHTSVTVDIPKKTADTSTIAIVTNLPTSLPPPQPAPPLPPSPDAPDAPATPTMGQPQTSFSSSNLPPPPTSVPAPAPQTGSAPDAILNTPPLQAQPGSDSPPNVIPNMPPPQVQPEANIPQDVPPSGPGGIQSQPHLGQPNTNNPQHPASNDNAPAPQPGSQSGSGFIPGSSADTKSHPPGSSTSEPPLSRSRDQNVFTTSEEAQQPRLGSETASPPSPSTQSSNLPTQPPDEGTTNVESTTSMAFVAPSGATRNSNSARIVGQRLCKRTILMIVLASLLVL